MKADRRTLWGIALLCFANLLLEVVLTRIYSATMFYHFTFLAIALALFGLGAGGVYVYLRGDALTGDQAPARMATFASWFSLATILAVAYVLTNPMDIILVSGTSQVPALDKRVVWQLLFLTGVSALPFFFAGVVVSIAIARFAHDINRVYFFDLCGAAVAALLAGVLMRLLGGPSLVLLVAVLAAVAGTLFRRPRGLQWLPLAIAAALLAVNLTTDFIAVPTVKGVKADKVKFEEWNVFSRVTVDDKLMIKIDASAATEIASLDKVGVQRPRGEITSLAHALFPEGPGRVLIIGPGGGRDVVHALSSGTREVVGVEINPLIAETIMQEEFLEQSGRLYQDPRVDIEVADGRSYVRRSTDRFDLIQASLVDTWAATAAGAFALSENTLYTVEAFRDYYAHLTERGAVTMSRWHKGPSGETARLLLLAAGALEVEGVAPGETRKHIFYAVKSGLGSMVVKRTPFTGEELQRLEQACSEGKFDIALSPRTSADGALAQMIDAGAWSDRVKDAPEDLTPPTDDRPFFFYFAKGGDLWSLRSWKMNDPTTWLRLSFGCVALITLVFIVAPLLVARRAGVRRMGAERLRRGLSLVYFALLGLAFIIVEIALLQKLTLFLGHPSYALLVVLFSILLATAIGARLSGRVGDARVVRLALAGGLGLMVLAMVYAAVLGGLVSSLIGLPIAARIPLAGLLVGIPGVLMGFMMPSGIRVVSRRDEGLIPWGWGMNGATSVLGTVGATIMAIHTGFSITLAIGGILYGFAAAGIVVLDRRSRTSR